ncbi:hypothetical protein GCM10010990_35890 [Croceicoccus mobilis]|uniref:Aldehyde dehydrogenase domain-containing protein n=1 Tax=Croceicoccus mobilis TaxID=1703339 RepID=A0A916ZAB5_9SPHN|nr:hypothetical protein GCM10010990_35890 [Croceicoccus mobilis]
MTISSLPLADSSLLRQQMYIGGDWIGDADHPVNDPASGEKIAFVPRADGKLARQAIEAAQVAMAEWKARLAADRAKLLRR